MSTSDPQVDLISRLRRLYRAKPEVRPTGLSQLWTTEIFPRIDEDMEPARNRIRDKASGKPTRDTLCMPDLLMTGIAPMGAKQVLLTPCIWFFCGSLWCKKIVKEVARDLDWLGLYAIDDCRFEVGGAVLAASEDKPTGQEDGREGLQLDLEHGIRLYDQFTAYLHIQDPDSIPQRSAIGLACCATVTHHDTIISQKLARVAGIVEAESHLRQDPVFVGLTTCHNLIDACFDSTHRETMEAPQPMNPDTEPSSDDDETNADTDIDSDAYSDSSSCADEGFKNEDSAILGKSSSFSDVKWMNVSLDVAGTFVGFDLGSSTPTRHTKDTQLPVADLAVFKLPRHQSRAYNTYRDPTGELIELESHLGDKELGSDEVSIVNGWGAVSPAYPLAGPMHLCIRGEVLETVRLRCTKPLVLGSSGSCVVRGATFCGMIVAIFPKTQYALMISSEHIFRWVERLLPNLLGTHDVSRIFQRWGTRPIPGEPRSTPIEQPFPRFSFEEKTVRPGIWSKDLHSFSRNPSLYVASRQLPSQVESIPKSWKSKNDLALPIRPSVSKYVPAQVMRDAAPFKIELRNDLVVITDAKMGAFDHLPPLEIACEDLTEQLTHRINHLQAFWMVAKLKTKVGLRFPRAEVHFLQEPLPESDPEVVSSWKISIRNLQSSAFYFAVLNLTHLYGVHQVLPPPEEGEGIRVEAGRTWVETLDITIPGTLASAYEEASFVMEDVLKVLITPEPVDLSCYELGDYNVRDRVRSPFAKAQEVKSPSWRVKEKVIYTRGKESASPKGVQQ